MLLNGQKLQKNAHEILGEDYLAFCDALIEELPKLSVKEKCCISISNLCLYTLIMSMILFVTSIFRAFIEQENIAYLSISLSDIFVFGSFIFIAERIVTYIGRTSIQNSTQEKRKFMISIVGSGLFILLVVFLFHEITYKVSIIIWLLCNIILCTVYMLLNKEYQ